MNRDYYKVLLLGQSGKGKTYSFRNMNPATTGFINAENKPLPFKNNFKYHKRPTTYVEVLDAIKEYAQNPDIQSIVIDSFSAYVEMLMAEARATKKGFDVFNFYNDNISKFITFLKKINKETYITGHYEILGIEGTMEKRMKVKGKEWEGVIEREFTIVMYADNKFDDKGKPNYYFDLASEGTSAKCPPDIFGSDVYRIPNDVKIIDDKIKEFVGELELVK